MLQNRYNTESRCLPRHCVGDLDPGTINIATLRDIASSVDGPVLVGDWVRATARQHGIRYQPLPVDVFAGAVSRLSDAEVELDTTEQLLLALVRKGVVTEQQRAALRAASLHHIEPTGSVQSDALHNQLRPGNRSRSPRVAGR